MHKTVNFFAIVASVIAVFLFTATGCNETTQDPAQKIEQISKSIKIGTGAATSIGLLAIPNADEADEIAAVAIKVLEESIIPLLNGDEAGIVNGLEQILDLSVLDNPKLSKLKAVLQTALPLLRNNLPEELIEKATNKLKPEVKAYISAFFNGVLEGAQAYLVGDDSRASNQFKRLRLELSQ